ncbi:Nickel-dependent hydrogenase [Desulfitobacterium hafniense DP7]|uniref:Nickel-dependent hydrogenase n=1 Tax=Desulfitobacterium hafniense DP7 TaxID=537010 RepID=G9XHM2_DESHA|nr:nickel-dependent hydrogenase large subunit [Desulfitobacterium hafniense]EHL08805.1 Nickel-dependent hydrogenase [Desulfitobacterium hafniense DP7]
MSLLEKKVIFPFTRIHNPMLVEAYLENGVIQEAFISDTLYRGFEQILEGRPAFDMPYYTQRICGICSSVHAVAAAFAVEQALGMTVPSNGLIQRNLIMGSDFLQNHIRHFYLMSMPDYFKGPDIPPFTPHLEGDIRFNTEENQRMTEHYFQAVEISRDAHAAFGVFGGKAPHGHGIVPGGCTMHVDADKINRYRGYLIKILEFINNVMIPDIELLVKRYPEYVHLGKGNGSFLSVGGFTQPDGGTLFPHGIVLEDKHQPFDDRLILEEVTTSWYKPTPPAHPWQGITEPDKSQPQGYTWVKAPRYQGHALEVGPLARAVIAKEKIIGYGTLGRHWSRVMETKKIAEAAMIWLERLVPGAETLNTKVQQESGMGIGYVEAMRGTLGHWVKIEKGRVKHYQIITPSTWNFSSRDEAGNCSVGELSIRGLTIKHPELKEAGRVIRSFDPCFSCSVHLIDGEQLRTLDIRV